MALNYVNNVTRISFEIRTTAGVLTSPAVVVAEVEYPNGSLNTVTATEDSTGMYHYDHTNTVAGNHKLIVDASGGLGAHGVGVWYVTPTTP